MAIVNNGKSTFTIVIPSEAPASVKNAAQEMKRDIKIATDADLEIQNDSEKIDGNFISLGNTVQAKSAEISSKKIEEEAYRIVIKGGNLYIIGIDTPDGGWTKNNGTSNGTANGVYTFLEDYLDVRWLMPGDIGRDIPRKSTFTIEDIDRTFTPKFKDMRRLSLLRFYVPRGEQHDNITAWTHHLKAGLITGATNWSFHHNWWETVNRSAGLPAGTKVADSSAVTELYGKHPEWFAMDKSGKRPLPENHYAKLETTNQELVKWFANQSIKVMENNKRPIAYSLSPSDGRGWSLSSEAKALYEANPDNVKTAVDLSMSSLVLKWYDDIAKIVAEKAPGKMLTGYIYSNYIYPPQKVEAKLPDNFAPMIAPSHGYGYGMYREDVQKYFHTVMDAWADIVTGPWFYYDLPSNLLRPPLAVFGDAVFPGGTGLVTPPGTDNLNIIFKQLLKSHINGVQLYGDAAWSNAALTNYVMAKLLWDPTLDANDVQKEWLHRTYGDAAGVKMEEFYNQLDAWFRDYYQKNKEVRYELTPEMTRDLFGKNYPEMERLFLEAKKQEMTEIQKERLQLIEDNLIVLQWRLRNADYLPADFSSPLRRSDAQISKMIATDLPYFPRFSGVVNSYRSIGSAPDLGALPWKVQLTDGAPIKEKSTFPEWEKKFERDNADWILLYAAQEGNIHISTQKVRRGAYFAAYKVYDEKGDIINSGVLNTEKPIVIPAKEGQSYILSIPQRRPGSYHLQIKNATMAKGVISDKTLHLSSDKQAPIYVFYAPKKLPTVGVGVFGNENDIDIQKPYSINTAYTRDFAERKFDNTRMFSWDEDWLFAPDPKDDGISRGVLKADFDDSKWAPISPVDWWQFEGFPDYKGPAWYRLKFDKPEFGKGERAFFFFGGVDGDAEVYLNGKKIKEHLLGKDFKGWNSAFAKEVKENEMKSKDNILAIKVTSKAIGGSGIHKGVTLIIGKRK